LVVAAKSDKLLKIRATTRTTVRRRLASKSAGEWEKKLKMHLRARKLLAGLGLIAAALTTQCAVAASPPVINSVAISVEIDNFNQPTHVVNLRDLGVIGGTAPLRVTSATIFVNGQTPFPGVLQASVFPSNGPGQVCIVIDNGDFGYQGETLEVELALANLAGQTFGPARVSVNVAPGPEIDPQDAIQADRCNDRNTTPVANAGGNRTVADSNGVSGELVVLDGSASSDANTDNLLTYQWTVNGQSAGSPSMTPQLSVSLPDGDNDVTLTVTDDSGDTVTQSNSNSVVITVVAPPAIVANAGADQTVNDTDGVAGEAVTLNAGGSTGAITDYQWVFNDTVLGTGQTLNASLPDGVNTVTLVVTASDGESSISDSDDVVITVNAPSAPTANAGADRTVADSDQLAGETVTLDGSASTTPTGAITAYDWYLETGSESRDLLGSGVTLSTSLPDGINTVTLEVTNSAALTSADSVQISIDAAPERTILSELPNLTPNQKRMASALDGICGRILDADGGGEAPGNNTPSKPAVNKKARALATEAEQSDLVSKCRGLLFNNTAANQVQALDELNGEDFAVARTQTLLFANFQYAGIMDRLMALRGGARGLSLAGLNIMIDGKAVPLATLQRMAADLLGGGAASDADEVGGLLNDKWGLWMRGNYSTGEKDASASSPSFDADQFAVISGLDYRLSEKAVIGLAMAYGDASVEFNPRSEGALDTTSWAASVYGSMYAAKNFYFDGIVNVADSDYAADRNITYVDGQGLVNADASGDTGGMTLSAGLSVGYDFLVKGLTISPNLGAFYIDATIDSFTEAGAGGLNLIYDEQNFESLTANLGLRVTYAWNHSWGVLLPHIRVDYVREFEDDVDVFGVRFAADPNAGSTPPILVETDNPDTSYWRLAGGFSAQFKFGFSGYVEYQRLQSFQFISFQDISVGLRMQKSF
jgi:uncharacterized protein YhjY with autotransporter beta-barrel domain